MTKEFLVEIWMGKVCWFCEFRLKVQHKPWQKSDLFITQLSAELEGVIWAAAKWDNVRAVRQQQLCSVLKKRVKGRWNSVLTPRSAPDVAGGVVSAQDPALQRCCEWVPGHRAGARQSRGRGTGLRGEGGRQHKQESPISGPYESK